MVIQMQWMKMICNDKNMMIQGFQHNTESRWIEVQNVKMCLSQLFSMMIVIQNKSNKVVGKQESLMQKSDRLCSEAKGWVRSSLRETPCS
jgi:hypothetical protein